MDFSQIWREEGRRRDNRKRRIRETDVDDKTRTKGEDVGRGCDRVRSEKLKVPVLNLRPRSLSSLLCVIVTLIFRR